MARATQLKRELALAGPYDLNTSLVLAEYGRSNPCLQRVSAGEILRASQTPQGPVGFRLCVGADKLEAEAHGPGARWLLDSLPAHLGLDDEAPRLPGKIGALQRRHPGLHRGLALDLFDLLTFYVIRQRVATRDAIASQNAILRAHAKPAPGPWGLRLPLSGAQWCGLSTADLAGFGLERKRAKTLLGVAARAERIRSWAPLPAADFARRLQAFTGIGPWTRAMVQGFGLREHDVVPLGDDGLPSKVAWFFAGEPRADDARMLELLAPYAGQRFRVVHLVWVGGERPPRFGPRIRGAGPGS